MKTNSSRSSTGGRKNTAKKKVGRGGGGTATTAQQQQEVVISSVELLAVETEREALALLRRQLREAELRLAGHEADLVARLDAGAMVTGPMTAVVETIVGDCRPAWKGLLVEHMHDVHGVPAETTEARAREVTAPPQKKALVIGRQPADADVAGEGL